MNERKGKSFSFLPSLFPSLPPSLPPYHAKKMLMVRERAHMRQGTSTKDCFGSCDEEEGGGREGGRVGRRRFSGALEI